MKEIVKVTENKCKQCYSCVRNCPVNAIQIRNGQATIMYSRCISCGKCIKTCPQNAKMVLDNKEETINLINEFNNVIACLAPSFVVSFCSYPYKKVVGALKELGFSEVWEVAVGAEELVKQIDKYVDKNNKETYISTPCPAFINMVEKHYPEITEYLLPFSSPMIATAKIIKDIHKEKNIKIVFIGPCVAKKSEILDPQFEGLVDSVLTFKEIKEIFKRKNIDINSVEEKEFDSVHCGKGKLFPLSGGLLSNIKALRNLKEDEYIFIEDQDGCLQLIETLTKDKSSIRFVDVLMCKGCIEGPKIDSDLNYYEKIRKVYEYYQNSNREFSEININVDLRRHFRNRRSILPFPSEEEIREVLRKTNKYTEEDELNCGACGYSTCREKAIAVIQGIAEVEMCLPYLISKKTKLNEELSEKIEEVTTLKEELEAIIESSYDGLVVTDGNGRILMSNRAWKKMIGYDESGEDNKYVQTMEQKGIIFPSATLLALKEKRRVSFVQNMNNNKEYLTTATPIFNENGEITRVVSNIRDIGELNRLKKQIEETRKLRKYHLKSEEQQENIRFDTENIVANSIEFGRVLEIASNVASVDSTILILGESGVGKEVVARFIHGLSKRKDKPLIKINCGAIPENLIESELFGYETGAFTGARKRGKPGLIELANEGTLFLDEIGELPLNVQVKLLRVLQERKYIPIGGTEEKTVDVRIIAATNRDLYNMVQTGKFRADLYYRLNVVPIEIPPLRERKADILPLSYHFIEKFNNKYGCNKELTYDVERILLDYSWPGNVRELENLIERIIVTTREDVIDVDNLPIFLLEHSGDICKNIKIEGILPLKEAVEVVEKELIEKAYRKYKTTYEMAKALGVNQSTVVRKIQKYIKEDALEHN